MYTPDAGPMAKDKFTIVGCSVYRMADVYSKIEAVLGLDPGEGKEYCEGLLNDQPRVGVSLVSFLILRFSEGVTTWLDRGALKLLTSRGGRYTHTRGDADAIMTNRFEKTPYNKNWRKDINKNSPPQPLTLRDGIQDAEFD